MVVWRGCISRRGRARGEEVGTDEQPRHSKKFCVKKMKEKFVKFGFNKFNAKDSPKSSREG